MFNQNFLNEIADSYDLTSAQKDVFIELLNQDPKKDLKDAKNRVKEKLHIELKTISRHLGEIYKKLKIEGDNQGKFYRLKTFLQDEYNKQKNLNQPNQAIQSFKQVLQKWKRGKKIIYSAPGAVFFSGEHAVVFGHPAIYYPIPLRLYVHIEPDKNINQIFLNEYQAPDPNSVVNIDSVVNIKGYGRCGIPHQTTALNKLFREIISPFLKDKSGFKINVLSSIPVAVGLNSSGAFSVALSQGLVDIFLDVGKFKRHFNIKSKNTVVLVLAWAIENCFHSFSSSGAGIHASFYGRQGKHPIVYSSCKRSNLHHRLDSGYSRINVGEGQEAIRNLLKLKTFVFDPSKPITHISESCNDTNIPNNLSPYPSPPDYNISILYSGIHSTTEDVLANVGDVRRFVSASTQRVNYVHDQFKNAFPDRNFQRSLEIHSEILSNIYLNTNINDKDDQLEFSYKELMMESLGNLSIGILNSVLSDWKFIPELMNSCQNILSTCGVSTPEIDYLLAKLQVQAIQHQIFTKDRLIKIGGKLTGAGKGGDMIILSLYDEDTHKKMIESVLENDNEIHYSCSLLSSDNQHSVEGVKKE